MTPDQIRADERARIVARLEARAVSEDADAERRMMLLDLITAHVHMHAATALREEARAIAALGPVAPVDDALLLRVGEGCIAWLQERAEHWRNGGHMGPPSAAKNDADTLRAGAALLGGALPKIIARAKGGA